MSKIKFIIVSGLSGAGKTQVMNHLEDQGYFCMDNFPIIMYEDLISKIENRDVYPRKIAIALDMRGGVFLNHFDLVMEGMKSKNIDFIVIYLEATKKAIIGRYKHSRRLHPLINQAKGNLDKAIDMEREALVSVKEFSDRTIDTSELTTKELKEIVTRACGFTEGKILINCFSFGFKYGVPMDADLLIDVRFLPNPYYDRKMKNMTGLDKKVSEFVLSNIDTKIFIEKYLDMLKFLIPKYKREGKKQLTIGIGCTGGQHRSVSISIELQKEIHKQLNYNCAVYHREIYRYIKAGSKDVF